MKIKYVKKHSKVRFPLRLWDLATFATRQNSQIVYWEENSVVINNLYSKDVLDLFGLFFPTPNQDNLRRIINMYQGFEKRKTDQKGFMVLSHPFLKQNDRSLAEKINMGPGPSTKQKPVEQIEQKPVEQKPKHIENVPAIIENDFFDEICSIDDLEYLPLHEYRMTRIISWKLIH